MPLYPSKVLQARECASIPYPSVVFYLGLTFESFKESESRHLSFATCPCVTMCKQMLHVTTNGCLCNYFSNFDEVWSSFQLGCDYDLFHP